MFSFILVGIGTFFAELSGSIGKKQVQKKIEDPFTMGFLTYFYVFLFFVITVVFGASFHFTTKSLPTLLPRIVLEIVLAQVAILGVIKASRSTFSFIHLTTIPLLLMVDIILGYSISISQIAGMSLIGVGLFVLLFHNPSSKKGAGIVLAGSIIAVATITLFKYNITHFNSVAAEQVICTLAILVYFFIMNVIRKKGITGIKLLFKPVTAIQSMASGADTALVSFAYYYSPASIVITLKRTGALFWSIIFGRKVFHETHLYRKLVAFIFTLVGLIIIFYSTF